MPEMKDFTKIEAYSNSVKVYEGSQEMFSNINKNMIVEQSNALKIDEDKIVIVGSNEVNGATFMRMVKILEFATPVELGYAIQLFNEVCYNTVLVKISLNKFAIAWTNNAGISKICIVNIDENDMMTLGPISGLQSQNLTKPCGLDFMGNDKLILTYIDTVANKQVLSVCMFDAFDNITFGDQLVIADSSPSVNGYSFGITDKQIARIGTSSTRFVVVYGSIINSYSFDQCVGTINVDNTISLGPAILVNNNNAANANNINRSFAVITSIDSNKHTIVARYNHTLSAIGAYKTTSTTIEHLSTQSLSNANSNSIYWIDSYKLDDGIVLASNGGYVTKFALRSDNTLVKQTELELSVRNILDVRRDLPMYFDIETLIGFCVSPYSLYGVNTINNIKYFSESSRNVLNQIREETIKSLLVEVGLNEQIELSSILTPILGDTGLFALYLNGTLEENIIYSGKNIDLKHPLILKENDKLYISCSNTDVAVNALALGLKRTIVV